MLINLILYHFSVVKCTRLRVCREVAVGKFAQILGKNFVQIFFQFPLDKMAAGVV